MKKETKKQNQLIKYEERIAELKKDVLRDMEEPNDDDLKELDALCRRKKLNSKQRERSDALERRLNFRYGLQNGLWIRNTPQADEYTVAMGQMRHDVIKDYDCKTSLEYMLADRIVANYWRAMECDMHLSKFGKNERGGFSYDQLTINMIKELHKRLEMSERNLKADIILLMERKQPKLNIKVKTDNAYLAQNQQINLIPKENENIEPQ